MACPLFIPTEPIAETESGLTGRWPLIEAWVGVCSVAGLAPAREHLLAYCNLGYARGACSRFPSDEVGDAVRFTMVPDGVHFVVEAGHHPHAHGLVLLHEASCNEAGLGRQARAFRASYQKLAKNGK